MSETVTIRVAGTADADTVCAQMRAFYAESAYPFDEPRALAAIRGLIGDERNGYCWLIEADDMPVGFFAVTFGYSFEYYGRDAFLEDLYIMPRFRGRGIGKQAMAVAEAASRAAGVQAMHVEVGRDNERAVRLYAGHGFSATDRELLNKRL